MCKEREDVFTVTSVQDGGMQSSLVLLFDKLISIVSLCEALLWQMIYYLEGKHETVNLLSHLQQHFKSMGSSTVSDCRHAASEECIDV